MSGWVVLVHPDDVNVADAKAMAANYKATVVPNRFVKRGQFLLTRESVIRWAETIATPGGLS